MAFTVTDSCAVNALLSYLLGTAPGSPPEREGVPCERAREAAAHLARRARKTLGAGWYDDAVRKAWACECRECGGPCGRGGVCRGCLKARAGE